MRTPEQNRPLTPPNLDKDRVALLDWVRVTPLVYGRDSWRAFKALYKHAETARDPELLGALMARIDALAFPEPTQASRPAYNPIAALAASRDRLLVYFSQASRLESRPLDSYPLPDGPERMPGRPASTISWLGDSPIAVFAGVDHRIRSGALNVFDFASPNSAKQIASVAIGVPLCVAATETHAFVLVAPSYQQASAAPTQGWAQFIERTAAFIQGRQPDASASHQNTATLNVFDLTDPSAPTHVAALAVPDATGMSLHGTSLVIAAKQGGRQGLTMIDVSQPREPRIVGGAPVADALSVAMTDRLIFVLTQTQRWPARTAMTVVDRSNPANLRARGSCAFPSDKSFQTLVALGNQVYALSNHPLQLQRIDCSAPDKPVLRQTMDLPRNSYGPYTLDAHGIQIYVGTGSGIISFDVADPKHPFQLGDPPSAKTIGYMKRRARRGLRTLSVSDSAAYVETAAAMLTMSNAQPEALDLATHWAAYDILYGAGSRFEQAHHGRGTLVARNARLPRSPEYRAPDAWRERPDLAARLYGAPNRSWQVYDVALKMLRAAHAPAPSVTQENLARFLRSESPLLIREATRSVAERDASGEVLEADLIADAWYLGNATVRRALSARVGMGLSAARPALDVSARLFARATGGISVGALSRRRESTLMLLALRFPHTLSGGAALPVLGALLTSRREEIVVWTLGVFARSSTDLTPDWIAALEPVEPAVRQRALDALLAAMRGRGVDSIRARALVYADTAWKRESGWRALQYASVTLPEIFRALWDELFSAPDDSEALATALSSPVALATLGRTGYTPDEILSRLQARPALAGLLAPEAFATFALALPTRALVPLIATVGDDAWQALRPGLLASLQDSARSLAFWQVVWTTLPEQSDTILQARVLDDGLISETFLLTDDPEFLNTSATAFGPLLARWAAAHPELFPRGGADLLSAATHALPDVRAWGLDRALSLGLDLPFALRLLESELPASVSAGKAYFESAATEAALENALVLCDSPTASVRAYGQESLTRRWETIDRTIALERLCENPHPDIQAFLARLLLDAESIPRGASAFDRGVLRARGRARPAKELVKKRRAREVPSKASAEDVAMLLEVARSRTPRDAEWALSRLASLALAGEEIAGLTIDGAAGV